MRRSSATSHSTRRPTLSASPASRDRAAGSVFNVAWPKKQPTLLYSTLLLSTLELYSGALE
eukprot:scaffold86437_cov30-Tisochrysis_lutea.AAC.2